MNNSQYQNGLRASINSRKENLEKVKSLFHRTAKGFRCLEESWEIVSTR